MNSSSFLILGFLLGLIGASCAAEDERKNKQIDELTSIQLGDYSLKFEGDTPKTIAPDSPPGMTNFKKETTGPFLGLKFSTPLNNDFLKRGR